LNAAIHLDYIKTSILNGNLKEFPMSNPQFNLKNIGLPSLDEFTFRLEKDTGSEIQKVSENVTILGNPDFTKPYIFLTILEQELNAQLVDNNSVDSIEDIFKRVEEETPYIKTGDPTDDKANKYRFMFSANTAKEIAVSFTIAREDTTSWLSRFFQKAKKEKHPQPTTPLRRMIPGTGTFSIVNIEELRRDDEYEKILTLHILPAFVETVKKVMPAALKRFNETVSGPYKPAPDAKTEPFPNCGVGGGCGR
jgi:hypothetical protein